ncbi:hypothetical protein VF02_37835, partial [Nostoc linckia z1]|uniref:hypothetical protein n=1 Tax=Nostoc linckia TaxID=92942 RepID=UPI000C0233C1
WGDGGDKGDKERSLSGGFRPSELRRERLLPCLPCPLLGRWGRQGRQGEKSERRFPTIRTSERKIATLSTLSSSHAPCPMPHAPYMLI